MRKRDNKNTVTPESVSASPLVKRSKRKKYKVNQSGKRTGASILLVALTGMVIAGTAYIYKLDQQTIGVCAFNKNIPAGHTITANDIMEKKILKSEYDDMSNIALTLPQGDVVQGPLYIPYSRYDAVLGMNTAYSVNTGEAITPEQVTSEPVDANPWFSSIEEGYEIFVMDFNTSDLYTRYLYPGAVLRLRAISEVPTSKIKDARSAVAKNEQEKRTDNSFLTAVLPYTLFKEEPEDTSSFVAETIFDGIRIIDAQNSSGNSIFDIYYGISCMSAGDRQAYISAYKDQLRSMILPKKLVIVCSAEEASALAEYQASPKTAYKYTIVKDTQIEGEEADLFRQFADIANMIAK